MGVASILSVCFHLNYIYVLLIPCCVYIVTFRYVATTDRLVIVYYEEYSYSYDCSYIVTYTIGSGKVQGYFKSPQ